MPSEDAAPDGAFLLCNFFLQIFRAYGACFLPLCSAGTFHGFIPRSEAQPFSNAITRERPHSFIGSPPA
jgi:hypothetical protein